MVDPSTIFVNYSGSWPNVLAVNVSAPGAGDGTEFIAALVNNEWGKDQALLDYAGISPDGVTEAPGTSQFLTALKKGFAVGPGIGVTYWKSGTPAANGDRVLLLQGQVILIATYPDLVAATYCGDAANGTAPAFYKTSDAGGTTRDTAGTYFVLPDARGLSLKNIGNATVNTRTKTGPTALGEKQEDQGQGWQLGVVADNTGARNYYGIAANRDQENGTPIGSATNTPLYLNTAGQGNAKMMKAMNDGTNGDPRQGLNTRDSVLGTNFGITY